MLKVFAILIAAAFGGVIIKKVVEVKLPEQAPSWISIITYPFATVMAVLGALLLFADVTERFCNWPIFSNYCGGVSPQPDTTAKRPDNEETLTKAKVKAERDAAEAQRRAVEAEGRARRKAEEASEAMRIAAELWAKQNAQRQTTKEEETQSIRPKQTSEGCPSGYERISGDCWARVNR